MDDGSAELILDLLRQDVADVLDRQKGKQAAGTMTDAELALQTYEEELRRGETDIKDRRMARSMNKAVQDDGVALTIASLDEDRASDDRQIALRLGGREQTPMNRQNQSSHDLTEETLARFSTLSLAGEMDPGRSRYTESMFSFAPRGESSKSPMKGQAIREQKRFECVACLDAKFGFETVEAPCAHHYCISCIGRLFEDSLVDESLFPPRCCGEAILLSSIREILGPILARRVEEKGIEHRDPYRTYCANAACSCYILPELVQLYVGTCNTCRERTCTLCKKFAHDGTCEEDLELQKVLESAKREKWQRCFRCHTMVELRTGCFHITWVLPLFPSHRTLLISAFFRCRCGAEFCYVCGTHWKDCNCILWDNNRLVDRAAEVIARDRPARLGPPGRAEMNEVMGIIRERHECDHTGRWRRVEGRHRCEECRNQLPDFIMECGQCLLQACVRCRRNRLWGYLDLLPCSASNRLLGRTMASWLRPIATICMSGY